MEEYLNFTLPLRKWLIPHYEFSCRPHLRSVFHKHEHVIVVVSHSTPWSWLPVPCLLTEKLCDMGFGYRVPFGIMDRFFFRNPVTRPFAQRVTQFAKSPQFTDVVKKMKTYQFSDLLLFPEGTNCVWGDPASLREFRSDKFLDLAIQEDWPLLIVVHRGSESWGLRVSEDSIFYKSLYLTKGLPLFERLFPNSFDRYDTACLPLFPKPMPFFKMHCELFSISDFLGKHKKTFDRKILRAQLRAQMEAMLLKIKTRDQ